jgi:hypothetical protein
MLTIPGFPNNLLPVSCGDIGFFKKRLFAWKSGLEVPLLPLGPSCPLQTILLSDLVGYGKLDRNGRLLKLRLWEWENDRKEFRYCGKFP